MNPPADHFSCPSCNGPMVLRFRYTKMAVCDYCGSTVFLEDQGARVAGEKSVLVEYPSLLVRGQPVLAGKLQFTPLGRVRFDYRQGFWDEWWALDEQGKGFWISVDEGDYAVEEPVQLTQLPHPGKLIPGNWVELDNTPLLITERGRATCVGFEGELPERFAVGEGFTYFHLSGREGQLYTLEFTKGPPDCHRGRWLDPFEMQSP